MNIYGSLMDIYDEKNKDIYVEKSIYIYDEKHKNIYDEKTQTKKLYAPIINRNI